MLLVELAEEYELARKQLALRVRELRAQMKTADPRELGGLELRIQSLVTLQREARELRDLCRHYSERGYWRNEKYTLNSCERSPVGSRTMVAEQRGGQLRIAREAEEELSKSNRPGADSPATRDVADAIFRRLEICGDRSEAGRSPKHRKPHAPESRQATDSSA